MLSLMAATSRMCIVMEAGEEHIQIVDSSDLFLSFWLGVFLIFILPSRLIEAKDVVYECGPKCGCGPACVNRTSQKGLKYRLEVTYTWLIAVTNIHFCLQNQFCLNKLFIGRFFALQRRAGLSDRGTLFLLVHQFVSIQEYLGGQKM